MDFKRAGRQPLVGAGGREPARALREGVEAQAAAAFLAMDRPAKAGAMGVALPAVPEIAEIMLGARCRDSRSIVGDTDRVQSAKIIALEDDLDARRVGIKGIPYEFGDRAHGIPGGGVALEKVLLGLKI